MADIAGAAAREAQNDINAELRQALQIITRYVTVLCQTAKGKASQYTSKELMDYVGKGGNITVFEPKGTTEVALLNRLEIENVPFIHDEKGHFFIRDIDYDKVSEFNRDINLVKGNYYQTCSKDELDWAVANSKFTDKKMTVFKNLDSFDAETLKNKCNRITRGFMVGEDKHDGLCDVSVRNKYLYMEKGNDVCSAMLESAMSLHMGNEAIKKKQLLHDIRFRERVKNLKGTEDPRYIRSARNGFKDYVELNADGFTYRGKTVSVNSPDYYAELDRAIDRIPDKVIVSDLNAVIPTDLRPVKSHEERENANNYKLVAGLMDAMIRKQIGPEDPERGFERYQKEVKSLCSSLVNDKHPSGYKVSDIDKLKDTLKTYKISPSDLFKAVDKEFGADKLTYTPETEKVKAPVIEKEMER